MNTLTIRKQGDPYLDALETEKFFLSWHNLVKQHLSLHLKFFCVSGSNTRWQFGSTADNNCCSGRGTEHLFSNTVPVNSFSLESSVAQTPIQQVLFLAATYYCYFLWVSGKGGGRSETISLTTHELYLKIVYSPDKDALRWQSSKSLLILVLLPGGRINLAWLSSHSSGQGLSLLMKAEGPLQKAISGSCHDHALVAMPCHTCGAIICNRNTKNSVSLTVRHWPSGCWCHEKRPGR